jgi:hypothetical protein
MGGRAIASAEEARERYGELLRAYCDTLKQNGDAFSLFTEGTALWSEITRSDPEGSEA